MLKLVIFLLIGYVVYRVLRPARPAGKAAQAGDKVEDMLRCAGCGAHFPKGEVVSEAGLNFCSPQHRDQWTQRR